MPLHYRFYHACALHSIRHSEIVQTNTSLQSIQKRYILGVTFHYTSFILHSIQMRDTPLIHLAWQIS